MQRLIYIADPMCSWCYGFNPELTQLMEHYKSQIRFSIIMGGLRPGGGTTWNQEMKDMLRHHWVEIGEKTGQVFNFDLLEQPTFNYDTEPACRAVVVVRDLIPEKTFAFFKAIQKQFYFHNKNPNDLAFYLPICQQLGIPIDTFTTNFLAETYTKKTLKDFSYSRNLGIRGFPSLVFGKGETLKLVTHGYARYEDLVIRIEKIIKGGETIKIN